MIVSKKTDDTANVNKWQQVKMNGTATVNEWKRLVQQVKHWVVQQVKTIENEWQNSLNFK